MKMSATWIALAAALCAAPAAAELYRWVDEHGKVHYGDRIPPKYAKGERQVLNEAGVVTDVLARELTPEEREEKRRQEEAAKAERLRQEEIARYDQFLLSTYETPAALVIARDERLATLDGQIIANEKSVADTERILRDLRDRAEKRTANGKSVPDSLKEQIAQWDEQLIKGVRAGQLLRSDREKTAEQFDYDLKRYMYLKQSGNR